MGEEGEQIDWDVESLRRFAEKSMLSPVEMKQEKTDEAPAVAVEATLRCSDTGFLQISLGKYCSLLVWSIQNDCVNRDLPSETLQDQKRDKPKSHSSDPQVDLPKEDQIATEVTRSTATEQQDDRSRDEVFDESLHPVVRMHGMGRGTWNDRLRLFRKLFPREAGVHPNQRDTESCKNAFPNQVKEIPMGYELHWVGRKTTQFDSIYQVSRLSGR
jgi:hypothetical protein